MRRGKRFWRFLGLAFLIALGLALAVLALLIVDQPLTKKIFFSQFSRRTGLAIAAEKMNFRLFPLRVEATGLKASGASRGQKLSLELKMVQAEGSLGRLFSGHRPLFNEIYAQGARLRIRVDPANAQGIDWTSAAGRLQRLGPLQIRDAAVEMSFPGGKAEITGAELDFRSSERRGEFVFSLKAGWTAFGSDRDKKSFSGLLKTAGEIALSGKPVLKGEIKISSPRGKWNGIEVPLSEEIDLQFCAEYFEKENRLSFPELEISLAPLARASGPLQVRLGRKPSFDWSLRASLSSAPIFERLKSLLSNPLAALEVAGEIALEGDVRHTGEPVPKTEVRLRTLVNKAVLSRSRPGSAWSASLSGVLAMEGILPAVETAGRITLSKGRLTSRPISLQEVTGGVEIRLTPSRILFPSVQGKAEKATFRIGGEERVLAGLAVEGRARWELNPKRLIFEAVKLETNDFSPFEIQAEVGLRAGSRRSVRLRHSALNLGRTISFFHPLVPAEVLNWNPEADVALEAAAEGTAGPERKWQANGRLSARDLQLNNPGAGSACAGLAPEIRFSGAYSPWRRALSLDGWLGLAKGETLWREFYIDWAAHPLQIKWRGEYNSADRSVTIEGLEFSLFPLGRAGITGSANVASPISLDFQFSAFLEDPAALLALVGGPDWAAGFAAAWNGALDSSGRLLKAGDAFSLAGRIYVPDGGFRGKNGLPLLTGIEARLPFHFARGGPEFTGAIQAAEEEGYVRVKEARGYGAALGPLQLEIASSPNRWQIRPLDLDLWGGRASFGTAIFTLDPGRFRVTGRTSLAFRDGQLARVLPGTAGNLWRGGFSAAFPSVEISPEEITLQGEAGGSLFSGSWTLRNLRLERPFSAGRTLRCDLSIVDLDLEQMTAALPFGRVTGIIQGEIEDLAFSYGQPESFRIRLESVKKKGLRQTFSLKAVDSLTILSQGEGALPSQAFFLRFIPAFPYEKLGLRCSLKNDIFELGGLIKEDGVEYLVRKARPFGINIINRDPNKMISFKDMVSRLRRIGSSKDR